MLKIYRFNEDREGFGLKLKELMKENGFTIETFSERVGYDENTIKKWRSGERIPSIYTLKNMADLFGISVQELYLPNSIFDGEINEDLKLVSEGRKELVNCDIKTVENGIKYSIYLFQKMMFSFLSMNENTALENLFSNFKITNYGRDKLLLTEESGYQEFKKNFTKYISNQYGLNLPYKIDEENSKKIYKEFTKCIEFKFGGYSLCI